MSRLRNLDWEAVAGIIAALIALVLRLLHFVEEELLLAVALVLLAVLLLRATCAETRATSERRKYCAPYGRSSS